jgi:hypothetical protein
MKSFVLRIGELGFLLFVCGFCFLPGMIGLSRWDLYLSGPILKWFFIVLIFLLSCAVFYFAVDKIHNQKHNLKKNKEANIVLGLYVVFGIYTLLNYWLTPDLSLWVSSIVRPSRYIITRGTWLMRLAFFGGILFIGFLLVNFTDVKFLRKWYVLLCFTQTFLFIANFSPVFQNLVRGNGIVMKQVILFAMFSFLYLEKVKFRFLKVNLMLSYMFCIFLCYHSPHRQGNLSFLLVNIVCTSVVMFAKKDMKISYKFVVLFCLAITLFLVVNNKQFFLKFTKTSTTVMLHQEAIKANFQSIQEWIFGNNSPRCPFFCSFRQKMVLQCFYLWQMRPIWGIGYGNLLISPHNVFFEVLATLGIIGLFLFFSPLIGCVYFFSKRRQLSVSAFILITFYAIVFLQNFYTGTFVMFPYLYWLLPLSLVKDGSE